MTPEEEKVIEAARAWAEAKPAEDEAGARWFEVCSTLIEASKALRASRAPKPPMTAGERAREIYSALVGPYGDRSVAFVDGHIRAAESAAWDRAIERAAYAGTGKCLPVATQHWVAAHAMLAWHKTEVLALKGRCHEAAP